MLKCSSCNINVSAKKNFTQFKCPECGKEVELSWRLCQNCGTTLDLEMPTPPTQPDAKPDMTGQDCAFK